jgi:formyl-CoA transferase
MQNATHGPLAGVTILDLTLARAGPTCVRHLADWGAAVIRIQPPEADGMMALRPGADTENLHRNKRVISLNLKSPAGHAAFLKLAAKADVVVENMRVQVKHRLKIAWEDLHPLNPRLIYGSISGFGQSGPYAERAGVDQVAQGMGGLMSVTGAPGGGPMRAGIAISDMAAGTLLALAIMMALYERERTGLGRYVHTSLLESMIFMMDFQAARWLMEKDAPGQVGNEHPTQIPMGAFPTADGFMNLAASSNAQWRRLCEALGKPEWIEKPEWKNGGGRSKDRAALHAAIGEETKKKPTAHWVDALAPYGLPCGPIYTMDQVFADPQVRHLGMAAPLSHPDPKYGQTHLVNSPLNFEGLEKSIRSAAKLAGADTEEVLAGLGYSADEIAALKAQGAI